MAEQSTAIVTGASRGVGLATSQLLAGMGHAVVMVARNEAKLNAAAEQIRRDDPEATLAPLATDVTDSEAVQRLIDQALERFGRINAIANVAGTAPLQPIEQVTPEIWQQCVDSNLSAVVHMTAKAWPTLKQQGGGIIVNVSSMASFDPMQGFNIYGAAKAGVNLFTYATAAEGKRPGIQTVCIAPGGIETGMFRQHFSEKVMPKDKTLAPEEVARLIVDCITGERAFTPGETIQLPNR